MAAEDAARHWRQVRLLLVGVARMLPAQAVSQVRLRFPVPRAELVGWMALAREEPERAERTAQRACRTASPADQPGSVLPGWAACTCRLGPSALALLLECLRPAFSDRVVRP